MESLAEVAINLTGDTVMFFVLQFLLLFFLLLAIAKEAIYRHRARKGIASLAVTRSQRSMGIFYGAYLAVSGLLVAICLSVDAVKGHRIIWVITDTGVTAYLFIFNPWLRNKLIGWIGAAQKLEKT